MEGERIKHKNAKKKKKNKKERKKERKKDLVRKKKEYKFILAIFSTKHFSVRTTLELQQVYAH